MKTTSQNSKKALSRPEQFGTERRQLRRIDFALRRANRALNQNRLLALLRSEAPRFFELAEVVGRWVWISFDGKQPSDITSALSELGFHWNGRRETWQHPCGSIRRNPRAKYHSYFPADSTIA